MLFSFKRCDEALSTRVLTCTIPPGRGGRVVEGQRQAFHPRYKIVPRRQPRRRRRRLVHWRVLNVRRNVHRAGEPFGTSIIRYRSMP